MRVPRPARGFSIIELMVTLGLIGLLMAFAIPGIGNWAADARLRATAEALASQVRLAQAMAVSRNRVAVVVLTSGSPTYNATPVANGTNWEVIIDPLSSESLDSNSMVSSGTQATQHGITVTGPAMVCFNSLGQQTINLTTSLSSSVTCNGLGTDDSASATTHNTYVLTRTGSQRKYAVQVYAGGRVRMCDMLKTLSSDNPDGCPTS